MESTVRPRRTQRTSAAPKPVRHCAGRRPEPGRAGGPSVPAAGSPSVMLAPCATTAARRRRGRSDVAQPVGGTVGCPSARIRFRRTIRGRYGPFRAGRTGRRPGRGSGAGARHDKVIPRRRSSCSTPVRPRRRRPDRPELARPEQQTRLVREAAATATCCCILGQVRQGAVGCVDPQLPHHRVDARADALGRCPALQREVAVSLTAVTVKNWRRGC